MGRATDLEKLAHPADIEELSPKLSHGISTIEKILLPLASVVDPEDKSLMTAPIMIQGISEVSEVLKDFSDLKVPLNLFKAIRIIAMLFISFSC